MFWPFNEAWLLCRIAYYELAQKQCCASHPDMGYITLKLHWLREQRKHFIRRSMT